MELTQKEKAEALDQLIKKSKEYGSVRNACSVLIGYYNQGNDHRLVSLFTELRSNA